MKDCWFFLKLFKPHRVWLVFGILLSFLTTLTAITLLTLSGWFISSSAIAGLLVIDGNALTFNFMLPAAQIRALAITRTLGRYGERIATHEATFRVLASMRSWFFQQLIPLVPGRLSLMRSGDLLSRITADIDALDALYLRLLVPAIVALLGIIAVTAFLSFYAPVISLTTGLILIVASVWVPWLFNRLGQESAEQLIVLAANFRISSLDMLQGLSELITNQAYGRFSTYLSQFSDVMINTQRLNNRLSAISSTITFLLAQMSVLITLILSTLLYTEQVLSGAEVALVIFCVMAAFELVTPLPLAMQMLGKTQKAAQRIRQVADMPPTTLNPLEPFSLPNQYDIALENVSFRYSEQQDWVLKNINLSIPHGSKIAIVGISGSGKTTLLQLLMRYYDPERGQVLLNGQSIKHWHSDQLMTCFGVLSQRSQLFAASIRENLLIAKPSASEKELSAAIKAAGLEKFLSYLPDGIETWVGESGVKVSGGEARRIALARLYLKNAPLLIMDEPTEGLDSDTERDVFNSLSVFAHNKTVIMVTHREAGLGLVDVVYRMEGGVLKEFK
jgi:ATP-binding cassette, subfamily C, bacterial CydC